MAPIFARHGGVPIPLNLLPARKFSTEVLSLCPAKTSLYKFFELISLFFEDRPKKSLPAEGCPVFLYALSFSGPALRRLGIDFVQVLLAACAIKSDFFALEKAFSTSAPRHWWW